MDAAKTESVTDYYEGGSGAESSLAANEAAWQAIRFRPRVLRNVGEVSTELDLLGTRLTSPIIVAPAALHGLGHADGELATAAGAVAAGNLLALSSRSSIPLDQVAAAIAGPWWFQVYAMRNRALSLAMARRAAEAGATALVLTGDTPVVGTKKRATPGLDVAGLHLRNLRAQTGLELQTADVEQDPTLDFSFIAALEGETGLPVLVKGVLRGDDADASLEAGAAGLLVSNHGGRQLDRALPTAEALPEVVEAVGGAVPVLVDGGIRSGLDVLAALALGADAVLVGRPVLRALMAGGAEAVAGSLRALQQELVHAMRLAGATSLAEVTIDLIAPPAGSASAPALRRWRESGR
jgi:4-hydroxymandelate oxidase